MAPTIERSSSRAAGLILAFLLMGTTLGLVAAQPTFTYLVTPGADYLGYDIQPSAGPSDIATCGPISYREDATACETRCNATVACGGFVTIPATNCCYIKSRMLNPTVNLNVVSHVKAPFGYTYTVQNATDYPGFDYFPLPLSGPTINPPLCGAAAFFESAAACEIRCNAVAACVGFVHNPYLNCCYWKSALGNPNPNVFVNAHVKTGYLGYSVEFNTDYEGLPIVRVPGAPTSAACVFPQIGFNFNQPFATLAAAISAGATNENLNACIARCDNTTGCISISFYAGPNCCLLQSTVGRPGAKPGAAFYSKRAPVPCSGAGPNCAAILAPTGSVVLPFDTDQCGCTPHVIGSNTTSAPTAFCSPAVQCSACKGCNSDADCPTRYSCGASCGGVAPTATKGLCFPNCRVIPPFMGC